MADTKSQTSGAPGLRFRRGGALLRELIENAPIPTFLVDLEGVLAGANRAFGDLLGYEPDECAGLTIDAIVHRDDLAEARAQSASLADGKVARRQAERRYIRKNGDAVWVLASESLLPGARSRPRRFIVQAVDIDRRKRAETTALESGERWNFALESAGQGFWDRDLANMREFHSRMWKEMRGIDPGDEVREGLRAWLARVHPEDRERMLREIRRHEAGAPGLQTSEYRERHRDGHWMRILSRGKIIEWSPDGKPARIIGTDTDITGLKNAEEKLQFANTLLTTQMETSPDGILVVDAGARIISFNRRFADMWGISLDLLEAKDDAPVLAAVMSAMKDPQAFVARVKYLYEHPEEGGRDELETRDGRFIDRHTGALRTPAGEQLGRVWFFRDITERKEAEAEILRTARSDALTGLANRAVFMEAVHRAIAGVKRGARTFGVLYLDLDQFKDVNDTLGHPVGDELLKAVAERLRSNIRNVDVAARFGGDEFAIMVTDINEPADAAIVADTIIKAMRAPFMIAGNDIRSGVSIGISLFGPDEPDTETILSRADVALYRAKSERTGEYRFHTDAMDREIRTRVMLGAELREGIALGQLFLEYQPQVDIATGRIAGMEALVRWRHPVRGVLDPNLFIPVAEKSGLIATLGHWVLREACAQAKAWLDAGIAPEVVAVNLSVVQFKRAFELEREIGVVLAETGLPPGRLELELTEAALMAASREHNDVLQRLRESGVRLAIDDFGVGYFSLDYLRRFPASRIKIAQAFVGQIATEPGSAAVVKAAIGLARELGIAVVAEGVESAEQLELLKSWGCSEGQGFYFARPLAPADAAALLDRRGILRGRKVPARTAA